MNLLGRLLNVGRLFAFVLGYGLSGALVGGTLNRILVVEVGMSVAIVGLLFAVPLFISPLRAWFGYRSDSVTIAQLRREPYVLIGAFFSGLGVIIAALLLAGIGQATVLLTVGMFVAFLIHEIGRNLSHNAFQALVVEKFDGANRSRMLVVAEVITLLGLVMGAGLVSRSLAEYSANRLLSVTILLSVITFALSFLGTFRAETRGGQPTAQAKQARTLTFREALGQLALADKQVRLFFVIVVFTIIGTLAQDVLLEPFGGKVLKLPIAQTSSLTAFWGVGVMIAMLITGVVLVRFVGYLTILRTGLMITVLVFVGIILVGISGNAGMFRNIVLLMGLGTGLAGAGMLTAIANFTTRIRAGLLMGVWGFAMIFGRSLGALGSGVIAQIGLALTGDNTLVAYGIVFGIEAALLLTALILTTRLSIASASAIQEASRLSQPESGLNAALGATD
ncbi:MAG: BCD family MFS transporter [Anaerolineae bacterium]